MPEVPFLYAWLAEVYCRWIIPQKHCGFFDLGLVVKQVSLRHGRPDRRLFRELLLSVLGLQGRG